MFSIEESDEKALEIIKKAVGKVIDVTTACKDCPNWALVKELENYLRQHEDSIIKPKRLIS